MTEPVSAIVACPRCSGRGDRMGPAFRIFASSEINPPGICPVCNGTGLIRIRALAEDVPTIDRTGEDE